MPVALTRYKSRMVARLFFFIHNPMNAKLLLTGVIACMFSAKSQAQAVLHLWHADGTSTDVELYTQPKVLFQDNKVLVTSPILSLEYPKSDVLRFTYGNNGEGSKIDSPKADAEFSQQGEKLVFQGVKNPDEIAIYSTNGIRIPIQLNYSGSKATLSLSSIPSGVYLLSVNGKTTKFTRP